MLRQQFRKRRPEPQGQGSPQPSGTLDGTLAAAAIRDADPAAAPPEIRTRSGETLFVSAVQREDLKRFCQASQIRARVGPLMLAYNAFHGDWGHLGLADLLDAATATWLPERERSGLREITSLYAWAMGIANSAGPQPA